VSPGLHRGGEYVFPEMMVVLGDRPDGMAVASPNAVSVLRDEYPVVRALMAWSR
jgi:hypothetical protein